MNYLKHSNAIEHFPCRVPLGHRLVPWVCAIGIIAVLALLAVERWA